jgi:hypothetical protein
VKRILLGGGRRAFTAAGVFQHFKDRWRKGRVLLYTLQIFLELFSKSFWMILFVSDYQMVADV